MKYAEIKNWFENQLLELEFIKPTTENTNIAPQTHVQQKLAKQVALQTEKEHTENLTEQNIQSLNESADITNCGAIQTETTQIKIPSNSDTMDANDKNLEGQTDQLVEDIVAQKKAIT